MKLKYCKRHPDAMAPEFKTQGSACFDLAFCSKGNSIIKAWFNGGTGVAAEFEIKNDELWVGPGYQYLVPTGLHLDIPTGYSVRIHPRSSVALKMGLGIANSEGVIDSDYVDELFLLIYNMGTSGVRIKHGDRIAQGELVKNVTTTFAEVFEKPQQKTDRVGGIGSTGK